MKIEHVAIYVRDVDTEKDFFVKYFGAKANNKYTNFRTDFTNYFLTFEDGSRLEIMNRATMADPAKVEYRSGYHHIAMEVGDRKDVDDMTKKLQSDGYSVVKGARETGDGQYASVVLDPEGNEVELIAKQVTGTTYKE